MPWWEDAMVDFMISGGYNVASHIKHVIKKFHIVYSNVTKGRISLYMFWLSLRFLCNMCADWP